MERIATALSDSQRSLVMISKQRSPPPLVAVALQNLHRSRLLNGEEVRR